MGCRIWDEVHGKLQHGGLEVDWEWGCVGKVAPSSCVPPPPSFLILPSGLIHDTIYRGGELRHREGGAWDCSLTACPGHMSWSLREKVGALAQEGCRPRLALWGRFWVQGGCLVPRRVSGKIRAPPCPAP